MNLGAPSDTIMRSPTLPVQAGVNRDEQTKTAFIQRNEHDSRGSEGYDPSAQPRNLQKPFYESSSDDEEY